MTDQTAAGALATGQQLPELRIETTPRVIVSGALASRDFQDVHHDTQLAQQRGADDIFMNIMTTNGYIGRYVTDQLGPAARIDRISTQLGAQNVAGDTMTISGEVTAVEDAQVSLRVSIHNERGRHARSDVDVTLGHAKGRP